MSKTTRELPLMLISYNPDGQLPMVMRLRACLGKTFALKFLPIGISGKREREPEKEGIEGEPERKKQELTREEEEEAKKKGELEEVPALMLDILKKLEEEKQKKKEHLTREREKFKKQIEEAVERGRVPFTEIFPVEMVSAITMYLLEVPTRENAATLFAFAATSSIPRKILQDNDGGLERLLSRKFLGASHTRSRDERELGRTSDVAITYRWVIEWLNASGRMDINVQDWQALADENRMKPDGSELSGWFWWYITFLSNFRSNHSLEGIFSDESDGFIASYFTLLSREIPGVRRQRRVFHVSKVEGSVSPILNNNMKEPAANRERWEHSSAGADLVIIDMSRFYGRAVKILQHLKISRPDVEFEPRVKLSIACLEPIEISPNAIIDRKLYRKEIVIIKLRKIEASPEKEFVLNIKFFCKGGFIPKKTIDFLEAAPAEYTVISNLTLKHVYFDNRTNGVLDLRSMPSDSLETLTFGPSNLADAPYLPCPLNKLGELKLFGSKDRPLRMSTFSNVDCYPHLYSILLSGNVSFWENPVLKTLAYLPRLQIIILDKSTGSKEDVASLILQMSLAFANLYRRRITRHPVNFNIITSPDSDPDLLPDVLRLQELFGNSLILQITGISRD